MNHPILKTATALSLLTATGWAAMTGNTIEVTTGATIPRSWAQIQADTYAYSPMQTYTASGSSYTTKVYLPYDATDGVYYDYSAINFGTNEWGQRSFLNNWSANPSSLLYKLHFDTTVTGFSLYNCRIFTALADGNTVNIDYSTDGNSWVPLWSKASGNYENFTNQASGLSTQDLQLRFRTSGPNEGYYMAMVAAGPQASNYDWFVGSMNTLTVTLIPEPAALSLLGLGGLALLRRRPRA